MSIELMQTISTICYVAAILAFLGAATMFALFNIPAAFGRMTGRTARKGIAKILAGGISHTSISLKLPSRQSKSSDAGALPSVPSYPQSPSTQTEVLQVPAVQQVSEQTAVLQYPPDLKPQSENLKQTSVISSAFPNEDRLEESIEKIEILSEEQFLASNEIIL